MSSKPQRQCWSCRERFPHDDRYCPKCGADAWSPPQGRGAGVISIAPSTAHAPTGRPLSSAEVTAAGVVILATLALLAVWFWVTIWLIGMINKPEATVSIVGLVDVVTIGDYVTGGRVVIALFAAIFLTTMTWAVTLRLVSEG